MIAGGKTCQNSSRDASTGRHGGRPYSDSRAARFAVFLAIAAAGAIALWWLNCGRTKPTDETNVPRKTTSGKTVPLKPAQSAGGGKTSVAAGATTGETETRPVKRYGRSSNIPTSNTNNIHYASKTGVRVVDADGNERIVRSKPIFKTRADNMLWAAVRPGGMPSGLNALRSRMRHQTGSDEAFLLALRNQDITIEPDDPPHVVNAKKTTMEVKKGIIEELDSGRTFDDIYKELCEETRKERMYERVVQQDMRKIAKERDAAAMRKYVEDMNPVMREMGLKELRLPSWAAEDATGGAVQP